MQIEKKKKKRDVSWEDFKSSYHGCYLFGDD